MQIARYSFNPTNDRLIIDNMPTLSLPLSKSVLPLSLPPSQTCSDARANTLWFASLTISLMTAFLGLLVKQWLHEHLATEDLSALHRIRLRHSRESQMKAWIISKIARLLPILLLISLGLFSIGLCCFTSWYVWP